MKELKHCLICGSDDLQVSFNMGLQPLANNLLDRLNQESLLFPIIVNECQECTHKQLSLSIDRELLFSNYLYQTGVSGDHIRFFRNFVRLVKGQTVLDIGCNDGSLLEQFYEKGWMAYGIEPSKSLISVLNKKNIPAINDFFPTKDPINMKFDCITAFNVFAHNDSPHTFLCKMAELLNPNGRIYILTTCASIDNYYHEHISYFNPRSMMKLTELCHLTLKGFKEVAMHNKSYLFEISKKEQEKEVLGIGYSEPMVAYGAAASGIVLLNYYKIKPEYVVDDNKLKQGKYVPGINSPIVSADYLAKDPRDLNIIITAHRLFDEITRKIKKIRPNRKDIFKRII